jgi:peptidoglycan/xylan/chitin deacetylase (PgdA/CDA1 family)
VIGALGGGAALLGTAFSLRYTWWRPVRSGTPILMYHQIGPHQGNAGDKWRTTARDFERQLDHLVSRGYHGISLRTHLEGASKQRKCAVLTFDDGYAGVLENALPLLLARGFSATVFCVSHKLGQRNDWDPDGDPLLDAAGVKALHAAGLEIGSHGATHRALPDVDDAALAEETRGSKARSRIHRPRGRDVLLSLRRARRAPMAAVQRYYRAATAIRRRHRRRPRNLACAVSRVRHE